jgi:hypothetical protein
MGLRVLDKAAIAASISGAFSSVAETNKRKILIPL